MTEPKTAREALEVWRRADKYYGDEDGGGTSEAELAADAHKVVELARTEGTLLDELLPDKEASQRLLEWSEIYEQNLEDDRRHAEAMDPPPED